MPTQEYVASQLDSLIEMLGVQKVPALPGNVCITSIARPGSLAAEQGVQCTFLEFMQITYKKEWYCIVIGRREDSDETFFGLRIQLRLDAGGTYHCVQMNGTEFAKALFEHFTSADEVNEYLTELRGYIDVVRNSV